MAAYQPRSLNFFHLAQIYVGKGLTELAVQVVVTRELEGDAHIPMRILSPAAAPEDIRKFILYSANLRQEADRRHVRAVMEVCGRINGMKLRRLKEDAKMESVLFELMRPEIEAREEKLRREVGEEKFAEGRVNTLMESVQNLMSSLDIPADKAMDLLKIPPDQRQACQAGLSR